MSRFVWDDDDVEIISVPQAQAASITLDEAATDLVVEWEQM